VHDDHRPQRVVQPRRVEHAKERDHDDLRGEEQAGNEEDEQDVAAPKGQLGQGVAGQDAKGNGEHAGGNSHLERIDQVVSRVPFLQGCPVVVQAEAVRQIPDAFARDFSIGFQRGQQHTDGRQRIDQQEQGQEHVQNHHRTPCLGPLLRDIGLRFCRRRRCKVSHRAAPGRAAGGSRWR